jgi:arginine repressor
MSCASTKDLKATPFPQARMTTKTRCLEYVRFSKALVLKCDRNLLVLVTTTGSAQPIAAGIDYEDWPEVVGTIAGDDTVLIICPDERQANLLKTRIEGYLG